MSEHPFLKLKAGQMIILADEPKKFSSDFHKLRGAYAVLLHDVSSAGKLHFLVEQPGNPHHGKDYALYTYDYDCVILPNNRSAVSILKQD